MEGFDKLVFYFAIPQGTLPWQRILEAISAKLATYRYLSCWHSEWIAISQFRFQKIKWREFLCIV